MNEIVPPLRQLRHRPREHEVRLEHLTATFSLPDVYDYLVSYLDLFSLVAFREAFPLLYPVLNENHWIYSRMLRRLLKIGSKSTPLKRSIGVTDKFGAVKFDAFVQFVHWHSHTTISRSPHAGMTPLYRTSASNWINIECFNPQVRILDCLFTPRKAPGGFSSTLVLLGGDRNIQFLKADDVSYKLQAAVHLPVGLTKLACSPGGSLVLASGDSVRPLCAAFRLQSEGVVVQVFEAPLREEGCHGAIFVDEESFLTWKKTEDNCFLVTRHTISCPSLPSITVSSSSFYLADNFDCSWAQVNGKTPVDVMFWYKPKTDDLPGCLIYCDVLAFEGLHSRMIFVGDPSGRDVATFVRFPRCCRVCSCIFDPRKEYLYICVLFDGTAEQFLRTSLPVITYEDPGVGERLVSIGTGRLAVYRVSFCEDGFGEILPRFYLGVLDGYDTGWGRSVDFYNGDLFHMVCTERHLVVKFGKHPVCHLNLYSTPTSAPYFEGLDYSNKFAVAEDHRHAVYCGVLDNVCGFTSMGVAECPKYNSFGVSPPVEKQPVRIIYE